MNNAVPDPARFGSSPGASISGRVAYEDSGKLLAGYWELMSFNLAAGSGNEGHVETDTNGN